MKWDKCYTGFNNLHQSFPPLMSDGRIYTSFKTKKEDKDNFLKNKNIKNNNEYREYLIKNSDTIIEYNQFMDCKQVNNCKSYQSYPLVNEPYHFNTCYTPNKSPFPFSDLKQSYLSREQQNMVKNTYI